MFIATPHYHHQKEKVTKYVTAAVTADHGRQKVVLTTVNRGSEGTERSKW